MMTEKITKYINPFTDYGFKRLFGEEPNKDLLLDFLNELLKEKEGELVEITYLPTEKLPISVGDRKAIFDLYCTNERGEKFIVELQKTKQKYFKDRTVYYSTFPIQEQAAVGRNWDFELKKVYTVAILDFVFDEDKDQPEKFRYDVKLSDVETKKVFYDKLTFVYLEMPKFNKEEHELVTKFEKWLFVLKNLNKLERIPEKTQEKIFKKLFKTAEISNLNKGEFKQYQESLNAYRDIKNSVDTAREEGLELGREEGLELGREEGLVLGREEGREEGREKGLEEGREKGLEEGRIKQNEEMARNSLKAGLSIDLIIKLTGLTKDEIQRL